MDLILSQNKRRINSSFLAVCVILLAIGGIVKSNMIKDLKSTHEQEVLQLNEQIDDLKSHEVDLQNQIDNLHAEIQEMK